MPASSPSSSSPTLILVLLAVFLASVEAAGMELIIETPSTPANSSTTPNSTLSNTTGLNITVLDKDTTLDVGTRLKSPPPDNSTSTKQDDSITTLEWGLIAACGVSFVMIVALVIVFGVFYSDYKKRLAGYNQVAPEPPAGLAPTAGGRVGSRVIEVNLVHPCQRA